MKMIKNNKGISLIVLSITILVMAILAATVIIALEDSGIIGRSKNTVKNNNYADEYTRLIVIKNGILTDNLGTITVDEFVTELSNKGIITATVNNGDGTKTVTTASGFNVIISQNGTSDLSIVIDGYTPPASNVGGNTGGNGGDVTPEPTSTVTINSMNVSPKDVYYCENVDFTFSASITKSDVNEILTYRFILYKNTWTSDGFVKTDEIMAEHAITSSSNSVSEKSKIEITSSLPINVTLEVMDTKGVVKATMDWSDYISVACLPAGTMILVEVEEEDENGKKKKRRKKKRIEDITYEDDVVVWDFDNARFTTAKPLWLTVRGEAEEYNLLKFSDGSELKTVRQHRIFNKELGKFTYPMTDETPIGTTTFNELGEEVTLVSKEVVEEKVSYYNIITHYHMNAFAEGILTSCRFSNLYDIKNMKYVKDDRELVGIEEYKDIPEEYYYGLRLAEQPKEVNRGNDDSHATSIADHVRMYISRSKKK